MPAPASHARTTVAPHHRADRDRGVEVAREVDVPDHSRVGAALGRLERVDDLHRPHLGRAADGAGGERGAQHVDGVPPVGQLAGDLAGEVHDVRVLLEHHELLDLLGPELHDTPDVVPGEIDQHHVLGALLRMLRELGGHPPVVGVGATAPPGPRDRAADHAPVEQLHHRLRRRAHQGGFGMAHEVHVGRRVDLAQHAVHVERIEVAVEVEALREDDLEDVAGEDVLTRHLDGGVVHARRPWST